MHNSNHRLHDSAKRKAADVAVTILAAVAIVFFYALIESCGYYLTGGM